MNEGQEAERRLKAVLQRFDPALQLEVPGIQTYADIQANLPGQGLMHFELKMLADAQPQHVQTWLRTHASSPRPADHYLVLCAPWMSERAMDLCEAAEVGALDLTGNYRLRFGPYLLERLGRPPPPTERRSVQNLYSGKSLQIVRTLLSNPDHVWQVQELARAGQVSLGTASGVTRRLRESSWVAPDRLSVNDPEGLLRAWAEWAKPAPGERLTAYTTLHGARLTDRLTSSGASGLQSILAGSSAAAWMAPYLTGTTTELYVDTRSWTTLARNLGAEEVQTGGNLRVLLTENPGIFLDRLEVRPGLWAASPAQTFVDLWRQGNRGREAAEKLLGGYLWPTWRGERPYTSWPLRDQAMQGRA